MKLQNIYVILYNKIELLQPSGSHIENKEIPVQKPSDKNNNFPVTKQTF